MTYYDKYLKYKEKYISLGGSRVYNIDNNSFVYINDKLTHDVEFCGIFDLIESNTLVLNENSVVAGINKNGRKSCTHIQYSKFIWHTHPNGSKYYPSNEDIYKILKHKSISDSYIFTPFGYWHMHYSLTINNKKTYDFIDKVNKWFYFNTNKGREYNKDIILKYCTKLNKIKFFSIKFQEKLSPI